MRALGRFVRGPMIVDSSLILTTTVMMAAAGSIFWVIAARLHTTHEVGIAGSLITAMVALSYLAQQGLNLTLVRTLPDSRRPGADVATSVLLVFLLGLALGGGYALLAPTFSSSLRFLGESPALVLVFAVLVAGNGVNLLSDAVAVSLRALPVKLAINGIVVSLLKCSLPFALVALGAVGLFMAAGLPLLVAAVLSVVLLLRRLPRPQRWFAPSAELRGAVGFARTGYAISALDMLPLFVLPILIINVIGPSAAGVYFVAFQIATLLNSVVFALEQAIFAEGSRRPDAHLEVTRRGGRVMGAAVALGAAGLVVVAPWVLSVFGAEYADQGVHVLRILALGALGVALNNWSMVRLRLARNLPGMLLAHSCTSVAVVAGAAYGVRNGLEWVAVAWGVGHLVGGLVAWAVDRAHRRRQPLPTVPAPSPARVLGGVS